VPLIIDDFGINHSSTGLLTSLVALVHIVFAIPASMLVGRVGLKTLIVLGSVASSAPLLSFMAADSFPFLLALRAVYGLGFVMLFPAVGPLFMQWFRPKELPFVNGILVAAVSLGIATSTFIVAPLSEAIGWDVALSTFGGVSLFCAVCWLALGRVQGGVREIGTPSTIERVWAIFRSRNTLLVVAADAGPLALLTVALAWLPTFYNEAYGVSLTKAGALMGLLSLAGVVSLVLASLLSTRMHKRRPFLIIPGILVGFAGFGTFLLADSVAVYLAVVALGFACWFYVPVLVTIPMELHPTDPNHVSVIFALLLTIGGVASFLAPLSVGVVADVTGSFVPGLALFATLAWSLGIAGFLLPETGATVSRTKSEQ
jgi:cyanate permease